MKCASEVWFRPAAGVLGLALLVAAVAVRAQEADPTARAVRLSFVDGGVQLSQGGAILADPALANTPIFEGSQISTGEDGRAELQFEDGSVIRISPNSSLRLKVLRQQNGLAESEAVLDNGLGYFELQGESASSQIKVGFNSTVLTATGFTVIRVNLDNPPGEVAVFSGNAHLEHGTALSLDLHGGETVSLNASDPGHYNLAETIEPDSWDAWNSDRDQVLTSQEAARTAATNSVEANNNPAWGDLDANGNWYNVPGQGYVWSPYQGATAGWDPYGCGNWVWTPRYGYIWVSCNSWGYLPYSIGFWNYYDGFGWCWNPGYNGGYWWNNGGWGSNVGTMPVRYQPPHRPRGTPIKPGGGGSPIRSGGKYQPNPVISYYHGSHKPTAAPVHVAGGPVTIAGSVVQPLRPISLRPTYNHEGAASSIVSRPPLTYPGLGSTTRPVYSPWLNTPGGSNPRPGTWSGSTNSGGNIYRPSAPNPGFHGSGAPAPHPIGGSVAGGHVGGGGSINNGGHVGGGNMGGAGNMGGGHVGGGGNVGGGGGGHVGGGAPSPSAGPRH